VTDTLATVHRDVGSKARWHLVELSREVAALGADPRHRREPHGAAGLLHDAAREPGAEGLVGALGPQPSGDGVADHDQLDPPAEALLEDPVRHRCEGVLAPRLADEPAGVVRLAREDDAAGAGDRGGAQQRATGDREQVRSDFMPAVEAESVVRAANGA
jgi:hypothetical protein